MSTEALEGYVGSHTVKGQKRYESKKRRRRNDPGTGSRITISEIGGICERVFARGRAAAEETADCHIRVYVISMFLNSVPSSPTVNDSRTCLFASILRDTILTFVSFIVIGSLYV